MRKKDKIPPVVAISGPSGSGKTTICRRIAEDLGWYYSVSHTTRPRRSAEKHGKDYFFVDDAEFDRMIVAGEFLEWARVYDNRYGTSQRVIEDQVKRGRGVILDVDTQGAASIKTALPNSITIFIQPPSLEKLESRLTTRGRDSDDEIQKRLNKAQEEMSHRARYDHIVVNDDLIAAIQEIKNIIK